MKFQKSQPIESEHLRASSLLITPKGNPMSPLKNMAAPSPAKTHAHEMREKLAAFRTLAREAVAGRYEQEALHKARVGTDRPRMQRWIIRMQIIMTAASCSPAVASRRAKYDDDFRIPTLLGAQPFDIFPRAPRQRATHNIDMAIGPEKGGKLAHERLQSALPVRAKTRRQTITPDGTPELLCRSNLTAC